MPIASVTVVIHAPGEGAKPLDGSRPIRRGLVHYAATSWVQTKNVDRALPAPSPPAGCGPTTNAGMQQKCVCSRAASTRIVQAGTFPRGCWRVQGVPLPTFLICTPTTCSVGKILDKTSRWNNIEQLNHPRKGMP